MKFTLPKKKDSKGSDLAGEITSDELNSFDRITRIPVNEELLKLLPVGAKATITLVGTVQEAEAKSKFNGAKVSLDVTSVEAADVKNDFEELAEDD